MRLIGNMSFSKALLRYVQFSFRINGHKPIRCTTCAFHDLRARSKVPGSRSYNAIASVSHKRLVHRTTKGWKWEVKREMNLGEYVDKELSACEEGTEAVPHSALMSYLQQCSSVEEQINQLCLKVSLPKEDLENRKAFTESLHDLLMPFFPKMRINLFGSSINGFGFKGCDCDVSFNVNGLDGSEEPPDIRTPGQRIEIPTVADVESRKVPLETVAGLPPRHMLRFIRRIIRHHSQSIREPILLVKARHPILRFYDEKYNLFCDFSLGNNVSLRNTRIIRLIGNLDDRVMPLIKLLRYWAKQRGFIGDIDQFNSYAFSLIVVYFLQNTTPPVLPPVSEIAEKSGYVLTGRVGDEQLLLNDLKKFSPSKNTQTVEELLKEFFFYYMYFDFSQVLCPLTSLSVHKMEFRAGLSEPFEFSAIAIQDPFRPTYNLAHAAAENACRLFLRSVLQACESYQKDEVWVPESDKNWGISFLLDHPAARNLHHVETIEIPLETTALLKLLKSGHDIDSVKAMWFQKASKAIIDIFEHGLLFECSTMKTRRGASSDECVDLQESKKSIMNIMCVARNNVFSGRSNFRGLSLPSDTVNNVLEKEHLISVSVAQKDDEDRKRQVLFSFQCECFELQKEVPTVLVSLTFESYRPAVLVFLKEYLPKLVHSSL